MIFYGNQSGNPYYTSRTRTEQLDFNGRSPYFNFYTTQLWHLTPDSNTETLLWEGNVYTLLNIIEISETELMFVTIENDYALLDT